MNETPPAHRRRSLAGRLLLAIYLLAAAGLLLSHLAAMVSPQRNAWLALVGLGFGVFVFLNVLFLVYYVLRRRRIAWVAVLALLTVTDTLFGIYLKEAHHGVIRGNEISSKDLEVQRRGDPIRTWYSSDVLATVLPERRQMHAPLSPVDGRPMRRARLKEVELLVAAASEAGEISLPL